MKISPVSVWGGTPPTAINTGNFPSYKYQPGTILSTLAPVRKTISPTPTSGVLWGATPPTASGNPFASNTGGTATPIVAGGGGFLQTLNAGLFK